METEWNRSRNSIGVTVILPSLVVAGAFPSPDPDVAVATNARAEKSYDLTSSAEEREEGDTTERRVDDDEATDARARSADHVRLAHCTIVLSGAGLRREREARGGFEEHFDDARPGAGGGEGFLQKIMSHCHIA